MNRVCFSIDTKRTEKIIGILEKSRKSEQTGFRIVSVACRLFKLGDLSNKLDVIHRFNQLVDLRI